MPNPIRYIERTRRYYDALGFDAPYRWASNDQTPFTPLAKPLGQTRVALVTTAALYDPSKGDQGPGAAYNGAAKFFRPYAHPVNQPADTRISHIAYDRAHSPATDQRSWLTLDAMRAAAEHGRIGAPTDHFHGAPTNRSHRVTTQTDAPAILDALRADGAEAVVLVPNCPVCHQTVTLHARHLEAAGLPTVILGCARDIVEQAGAPRFVFSDFPLGNSAGKPHDPASQAAVLALGLALLEGATGPNVTVENPERWSDSDAWKADYSNPDVLSPQEIAARRAAFDAQKAAAKA